MKINASNHILTISEERCFDGKYHFYYCNVDNNPSEQIYTEELLENMKISSNRRHCNYQKSSFFV